MTELLTLEEIRAEIDSLDKLRAEIERKEDILEQEFQKNRMRINGHLGPRFEKVFKKKLLDFFDGYGFTLEKFMEQLRKRYKNIDKDNWIKVVNKDEYAVMREIIEISANLQEINKGRVEILQPGTKVKIIDRQSKIGNHRLDYMAGQTGELAAPLVIVEDTGVIKEQWDHIYVKHEKTRNYISKLMVNIEPIKKPRGLNVIPGYLNTTFVTSVKRTGNILTVQTLNTVYTLEILM